MAATAEKERHLHVDGDDRLDRAWSTTVQPRRNRISVPVPVNFGHWSFRVVLIPIEQTDLSEPTETPFDKDFFDLPTRYAQENWDGYGAKPLNAASYDFARVVVARMPHTYKWAHVGIDADGEVTFEWYHTATFQCSLTFASSGNVCVMRRDNEKLKATFGNNAPSRIFDIIDEFANGR